MRQQPADMRQQTCRHNEQNRWLHVPPNANDSLGGIRRPFGTAKWRDRIGWPDELRENCVKKCTRIEGRLCEFCQKVDEISA
jgi:hypothetical protein